MTPGFVEELRRRLGADRVEIEPDALEAYRHDQWVVSILRVLERLNAY